jgi:hypothetical protein
VPSSLTCDEIEDEIFALLSLSTGPAGSVPSFLGGLSFFTVVWIYTLIPSRNIHSFISYTHVSAVTIHVDRSQADNLIHAGRSRK